MGLDENSHDITFYGKDCLGKKISQVADLLNDIHNICKLNRHIDLCILDINCNDFNYKAKYEPRHLVNFVLDLSDRLLANGVKRVALMEMTFCKGEKFHLPSHSCIKRNTV